MGGHELPVRWEGTGDRYWFASAADWAAATGQYELLRQLLLSDPNLLLSLTSLRRLRRLHALWDPLFPAAAAARAAAARRLFHDSPAALLAAGYGPWLLYCAAAAADLPFALRLLRRRPLLVFGEGEYGLSDLLCAAAAGRSAPLFRLLLRRALAAGTAAPFAAEVLRRAAHAAARGGCWEIAAELLSQLGGGGGVEQLRDSGGATLLHSAAARGHVEVIEGLLKLYGDALAHVKDGRGNASIHVAAFRGHAAAVNALVSTSADLANEEGDSALHVAIFGFVASGFRPLDRQIEVVKTLVAVDSGRLVNVQNKQGRTPLHVAMDKNVHADAVALLVKSPAVKVNITDVNGSTAFDLLRQRRQRPRGGRPSIAIRRLVSSLGVEALKGEAAISAVASEIRESNMLASPGTSFEVHDSELLLLIGGGSGGGGEGRNESVDWTEEEEDEEIMREEGEMV
ncbi:ankyrin repeat family protein [Wolffia australiana]